jgi:signal transduction histidine kinase
MNAIKAPSTCRDSQPGNFVPSLFPIAGAVALLFVLDLSSLHIPAVGVLLFVLVVEATYRSGLYAGMLGTCLSVSYLLLSSLQNEVRPPLPLQGPWEFAAGALLISAAAILVVRFKRRSEKLDEALTQHVELVNALERSPDLVLISAPHGVVTYMNRTARTRLGVSADARLDELTIATIQTAPQLEPGHEAFDAIVRCGSWRGISMLRPLKGQPFACSAVLVANVDESGVVKSITALCRDVADSVLVKDNNHGLGELYQSLERIVGERTDRLRSLEAKRSEYQYYVATARMAARVVHEINNPLGSIKNAALLLKRFSVTSLEAKQWLDLLGAEVDRIASIVRQMYSLYSPPEAAVVESHLDLLLQDIQLLAEPRYKRLGVTLTTSVSHPAAAFSIAENMVKQILLALIYNALEASSAGQRVSLHVEISPLDVVFHVRDTGVGIANSIKSQLFEPFFTTKRTHGSTSGVGLGLSVSRSLARSLGGDLEFKSIPGLETIFSLRVPLVNQSKVFKAEESEDAAA